MNLDEIFEMPWKQAQEVFRQRYFTLKMVSCDSITAAAKQAGMDRSNFRRLARAAGALAKEEESTQ